MIQPWDLHLHTRFCDGADSPEDMVRAALALGLECIGFSAHSYTWFDESYCLAHGGAAAYRAELERLKEKYRGEIHILCGIEQDFYSRESAEGYDYVIGSVHYLYRDGEYFPVDESASDLLSAAERHYGGDLLALAEDYYETVSRLIPATGADIIGHLDLISKFNEGDALFDSGDERYISACDRAVSALLPYNKPFEINTGAISRGYRSSPYPCARLLRRIARDGGRVLLSSDGHSAGTLCFGFEEWGGKARKLGLELSPALWREFL